MVTWDEIIEAIKTVLTKTVPIKSISTNFYVLLAFLLVTTALLIAVNYLLLPDKIFSNIKTLSYHIKNNKLKKKLYIDNIN